VSRARALAARCPLGRAHDLVQTLIARAQEVQLMAKGYSVQRFEGICAGFVIIGPSEEPAVQHDAADATAAMATIAAAGTSFASRGDVSGTDLATIGLSAAAGVKPEGRWYLSTGSGMGATLNMAAQIPGCLRTELGHG